MNSQDKKQRNLDCITSLLLGFISASILVLVVMFIVYDPLKITESSFIRAYSKALMGKNISKVHALSSPEIWDEIDEWINHSEIGPVKCSIKDAWSDRYSDFGICSFDNQEKKAICSYFEKCHALDYEFFIDDVVLRRRGISWEVISIESICESLERKCRE